MGRERAREGDSSLLTVENNTISKTLRTGWTQLSLSRKGHELNDKHNGVRRLALIDGLHSEENKCTEKLFDGERRGREDVRLLIPSTGAVASGSRRRGWKGKAERKSAFLLAREVPKIKRYASLMRCISSLMTISDDYPQ